MRFILAFLFPFTVSLMPDGIVQTRNVAHGQTVEFSRDCKTWCPVTAIDWRTNAAGFYRQVPITHKPI